MAHIYLLVICIPKNICSLTLDVVFCWFHCYYIFLGVYASMVVTASGNFYFLCRFHQETLVAFLNMFSWLTLSVIYMVFYLCVMGISTLMTVFFFTSGISWSCDSGVSSLMVPILIIDIFPVSGCNC